MAIRVVEGPVIRAGESLSEPLDCSSGRIIQIVMPDGWDEDPGQNKAALTFQVSLDGVTWSDLYDREGYEWKIESVIPNTTVMVVDSNIRNAQVKFRAGSRSDEVPQEAERKFKVVLEDSGSTGSGTPQPPSGSDEWVWVYSPYYGWVMQPPGGGGKPQPPAS